MLLGGSVTLNSTDPFAAPLINPNYLTTAYDIFAIREGIKAARRFALAPAWSDYIISQVSNATTEDEIDAYARVTARPMLHACGTAGMSARGAKYGVVDPNLTVKGTKGLRVVDASVIVRYLHFDPPVAVLM